MFQLLAVVVALLCILHVSSFKPSPVNLKSKHACFMSTVESFDPKVEPGVALPLGFFDPLALCPTDKATFTKFREAELKHGRVAMIAVLGMLIGEKAPAFFGNQITGPAIYQYQQAESLFPAWSGNVIGLALAIEGFNIVKGWESPSETLEGKARIANLKNGYVPGDLQFDPLDLKPTNPGALKKLSTKELNNGRLAMLAAAGIVLQELVTGEKLFH